MTKKQLERQIEQIYKKRTKAHNTLLECDILLDKIFKRLIK